MKIILRGFLLAGAVSAALVLTGCGSDDADEAGVLAGSDTATSAPTDVVDPTGPVDPGPVDPGAGGAAGTVQATIAEQTYRGLPPGVVPPTDFTGSTVVASIEPGGLLALTFWGSSSCPTAPTGLEVLGRTEVRVTASADGDSVCTMDLGPTTSLVRLDPAAVDVAADLTVHLDGVEGLPATVTASPRG